MIEPLAAIRPMENHARRNDAFLGALVTIPFIWQKLPYATAATYALGSLSRAPFGVGMMFRPVMNFVLAIQETVELNECLLITKVGTHE